MADKKYDFSAFDKPAENKYDFSAFEAARTPSADPAQDDSLLTTLKDGARGAAGGLTFGFNDEIAGALGAGGDLLTGNTSLERIMDSYRSNRDETRALDKEAEERSPIASTIGNIAGGLAPALLTAGASAPASGAALGARLLNAGRIGAASGAIAGLGTSEADTIGGNIEDSIEGAAGGALFGGLLQGGGEAVKGIKTTGKAVGKKLADTTTGQDIIDAFKAGKNKIDLVGRSGLDKIEETARNAADKLGLGARKAQLEAGAALGEVKKGIRESGRTFDVNEEVEQLKALINKLKNSDNPEAIKDVDFLQKYLDNLLLGKETEFPVSHTKFTPGKEISAKPSARDALEMEASKAKASAKALGQDLRTEVVPSEDEAGNKLLTLLKTTDENVAATERAIPIKDADGNVIDTTLDLGDGLNNKTSASAKTVLDNPAVEGGFTASERGPVVTEMQKARLGGNDPSRVSFTKAEDIKGTLNSFNGTGESPSLRTQDAINQVKQTAKSVNDKITQLPELAAGNKNYAAASQGLDTLGLAADDFIRDAVTGEIRLDATAKQKLNGLVRRMARDTDAGDNAAEKFTLALDAIRQANPKLAEALGPEVQNASRMLDLAQKSQKLGLLNQSTYLKSLPIKAANAAGQITSAAKTALSAATPDSLKKAAQAIMQKGPSGMKLASELSEVIKKDNVGRNASLFALQQNPAYRQMLNEHFNDEDNQK